MKAITLTALAFASALSIANTAQAQTGTVRGDYVGCVTEEALDQVFNAIIKKDERLFGTIMGKQCVNINGRQFSMLDRGVIRSKIRVYVGEKFVDLYTPSEAIR